MFDSSNRTIVRPMVLAAAIAAQACREQPPSSSSTPSLVQPEKWWEELPRPGYASLEKVGEFDGWFEVYRLETGEQSTYAIYEPYQFQEALSYLVIGNDRAALVDSGNGIGRIEKAVAALTTLPITVLLTHEHADHYGGSHAFEEVALFGNPEAVESVSAGVPNERAREWVTGDEVWHDLPEGVDPATFAVPGVTPTMLLEDGQKIDLGGRVLEVISTPGHSPASVSYLDGGNRLLFTGDHFYPGPLYAFSAGVDLDAYLKSNDLLVKRISEYDYVLSGHNEPWVSSEIMPRVSAAFRTIFEGGGEFSEDGELRRYRFEGFDVIVRKGLLENRR